MGSRSASLRRVSLALLLLVPPALGGCTPPGYWDASPWDERAVLAHGWVPPRDLPAEAVYCYRTLGTVDCYNRPEPDQADRREGNPLLGKAGKTGPS